MSKVVFGSIVIPRTLRSKLVIRDRLIKAVMSRKGYIPHKGKREYSKLANFVTEKYKKTLKVEVRGQVTRQNGSAPVRLFNRSVHEKVGVSQ
jgi:hypothetical protein